MENSDIAAESRQVQRSGLKQYFSAVEIVAEKDVPVYRGIVAKYDLANDHTWMVGNSPKSDINPALAAGINAIFVPHDDTWVLEHEELASAEPPRKLLVLRTFAQLATHF